MLFKGRIGFRHAICNVLGVLSPLLILVFELFTGLCRKLYQDPIPNWWLVGAVLFVSFVNFALLRQMVAQTFRSEYTFGYLENLLSIISLGICLFYSLFFVPIIPMTLLAPPLGLFFFAPCFALLTTALLRRELQRGAQPINARNPLFTLSGVIVVSVVVFFIGPWGEGSEVFPLFGIDRLGEGTKGFPLFGNARYLRVQ